MNIRPRESAVQHMRLEHHLHNVPALSPVPQAVSFVTRLVGAKDLLFALLFVTLWMRNRMYSTVTGLACSDKTLDCTCNASLLESNVRYQVTGMVFQQDTSL